MSAPTDCNKLKKNPFVNTVGMSKDDGHLQVTLNKKGIKERDPNCIPKTAALVNGKYVTYTRITR